VCVYTEEMKDFLELCRARCSVRHFADRPVEREKLDRCLEAARLAPSAGNSQPWRFFVFDDPQLRAELSKAVFTGAYKASERFAEAPVLVALLAKPDFVTGVVGSAVQGTPWHIVDCGIAGEHFALAAAEQGLGTCWIGWYEPRALVRFLGLRGKGFVPIALIALGYPPDGFAAPEKKRKSVQDIVSRNQAPE
jgi:nitroreductase